MSASTPTKQAWTPGPWRDWPEKLEGDFHVTGRGPEIVADKKVIARISSGPAKFHQDEASATAKLIAKAPELVEALQALVEVVDGLQSGKIWSRHNSDVNNAFDKAERILREAGAL